MKKSLNKAERIHKAVIAYQKRRVGHVSGCRRVGIVRNLGEMSSNMSTRHPAVKVKLREEL